MTSAGAVEKVRIEIVSPGLLRTPNNTVPSTIALAGPAFDVSIAELQRTLPHFNISHTYLYDESIIDCVLLQDSVQNILAQWYYRVRDPQSVVAVITPGHLPHNQRPSQETKWKRPFKGSLWCWCSFFPQVALNLHRLINWRLHGTLFSSARNGLIKRNKILPKKLNFFLINLKMGQ